MRLLCHCFVIKLNIMIRQTLLLLGMAGALTANAQLQEGKKNINKLCGCFDVDFKYAETFAPDTAYKFHPSEHNHGLELVLPIETSDKKIVLQHLLVVYDTMIIKHWREDWVYEATDLWNFEGDKQWTKQPVQPAANKNRWTQTVWEVDDAPRYQGTSEWVTTNNKTFWENTTDAPLPRREYTNRRDYNILQRTNRIIVTDSAWLHEQDNSKIVKTATSRTLLAEEKGMNAYVKVADTKCAKAKEWWTANGSFWTNVRKQWEEVLKNTTVIHLKNKVDNKRLDQYFTDIWEKWKNKSLTTEAAGEQVRSVLLKFTGASKDVAAN
jgi:hypothetical protein